MSVGDLTPSLLQCQY